MKNSSLEYGHPEYGIVFRSMGRRFVYTGIVSACFLLVLATGAAYADSIDGDWCSDNGRRISIAGPDVTVSKAVKMQGNYTRHGFSFTMPAPESDAGSAVEMQLQGETRVQIKIGSGAAQVWRRCQPEVS